MDESSKKLPASGFYAAAGISISRTRRFGASFTLNSRDGDPAAEIKRVTDGRGVDVAIEALGKQETFKLVAPYQAFHAGLGDQTIVTSLCPGGSERMRRLMAMVASRRVDLTPLVTHHFALDDIADAYELFSHQRDRVLKVALYPSGVPVARVAALAEAHAVDDQC